MDIKLKPVERQIASEFWNDAYALALLKGTLRPIGTVKVGNLVVVSFKDELGDLSECAYPFIVVGQTKTMMRVATVLDRICDVPEGAYLKRTQLCVVLN